MFSVYGTQLKRKIVRNCFKGVPLPRQPILLSFVDWLHFPLELHAKYGAGKYETKKCWECCEYFKIKGEMNPLTIKQAKTILLLHNESSSLNCNFV